MPKSKKLKKNQKGGFLFGRNKGRTKKKINVLPVPPPRRPLSELPIVSPYLELGPIGHKGHKGNDNANYRALGPESTNNEGYQIPMSPVKLTQGEPGNNNHYIKPNVFNQKRKQPEEAGYEYSNIYNYPYNGVGNAAQAIFNNSSNGNGYYNNYNPEEFEFYNPNQPVNGNIQVTAEQAKRKAQKEAEAERMAQEEAEAERMAQEEAEAERKAKEKAEAERMAQEEAEAERMAQEEAEAEAERMAQEEAEAKRKEQEKAEAKRKAQEKAEAKRKAMENNSRRNSINVTKLPVRPSNLKGKPAIEQQRLILRGPNRRAESAAGGSRKNRTKKKKKKKKTRK